MASGDGMNRRAFFHSLLAGGLELFDESRGKAHYILEDIPLLPASELEGIVPVLRENAHLDIIDGWLSVAKTPGGPFTPLEPLTDRRAFILGHFDGHHTLGAIGAMVGARFGLPADEAAGEARDFFIALTSKGVCHPLGEPR
jgi:hypothetical protein